MSPRRSAFVLLPSCLMASSLLGLLACSGPTSSGSPPESASSTEAVAADSKVADAMVQISEVGRALAYYVGLHDGCPPTSDGLVGPGMLDAPPVDPWGNPIALRCRERPVVGGAEIGEAYQVAISAGPDGVLDSEDDIFSGATGAEQGVAPAPPEAPTASVPTSVASHRVQVVAGENARVAGLWWENGWRVGLSAPFVRNELQIWRLQEGGAVEKETLKYTTAAPQDTFFRTGQARPMALDGSREVLELRPLDDRGVMALDNGGQDPATVAVAEASELRVARLVRHEEEGAPWGLALQGEGRHEVAHRGSAEVRWGEATVAASEAQALFVSVGSRRGDGTDGDRVVRIDRFDYAGVHLGEHEVLLPGWPGDLAAARVEADGTAEVLFGDSGLGGGGAGVTVDADGLVRGPFRVEAADVGPHEDLALLRCGDQTWALGLDIQPRETRCGLEVAALGSPGRLETPTQLWLPDQGPANRGLDTGGLSTACHGGEAAAVFLYETGSGEWELVLATWRAK